MSTEVFKAMPRKRGEPRDEKAVKLDRWLAFKARQIADLRGISIGEYMTSITRTRIEADFAKESRKVPGPDGSEE